MSWPLIRNLPREFSFNFVGLAPYAAVLSALHRHPGSTARELSRSTPDAGAAIGQSPTEWDYTCSRRLPGLEDAGMAEVVAPSFSERRPRRLIDPNVKPCAVTGLRSIRWWTKL